MMKLFKYITASALAVFLSLAVGSCAEADHEFEHDNTLLKTVTIKTIPGADGIAGQIIEYNAAGQVVPANEVTLKSVEGGHGVVLFELSPTLRGIYNPEHCYLGASLTFDQVIRPGLGGIKNITNRNAEGVAQGIDVTVTSGIGTVRPYTIIGYFQGEYQINPED
ncbi:MAG: hypothetical protein K2K94_00630 [Muribaculaceae bacterium]|nr:hypothetical protein [Muribaculaceae bacterium]